MTQETKGQAKIRELLLREKAELENRVERIHNHARDPLNADSSEQAAELGNIAVVSALETEAREEIDEIRIALQRMESGEYGICVSCGEMINSKRLEARPASAECLECAELSSENNRRPPS